MNAVQQACLISRTLHCHVCTIRIAKSFANSCCQILTLFCVYEGICAVCFADLFFSCTGSDRKNSSCTCCLRDLDRRQTDRAGSADCYSITKLEVGTAKTMKGNTDDVEKNSVFLIYTFRDRNDHRVIHVSDQHIFCIAAVRTADSVCGRESGLADIRASMSARCALCCAVGRWSAKNLIPYFELRNTFADFVNRCHILMSKDDDRFYDLKLICFHIGSANTAVINFDYHLARTCFRHRFIFDPDISCSIKNCCFHSHDSFLFFCIFQVPVTGIVIMPASFSQLQS